MVSQDTLQKLRDLRATVDGTTKKPITAAFNESLQIISDYIQQTAGDEDVANEILSLYLGIVVEYNKYITDKFNGAATKNA